MSNVTTKVYTKDRPLFARLKALPREQLLAVTVSGVPFCARVQNCLRRENILTLGLLTSKTSFDLLKLPGMGRAGLAQTEAYLAELGLALKPNEKALLVNVLADEDKPVERPSLLDALLEESAQLEDSKPSSEDKAAQMAAVLKEVQAVLLKVQAVLS